MANVGISRFPRRKLCVHAPVYDPAGSISRSSERCWWCCLPLWGKRRHPGL